MLHDTNDTLCFCYQTSESIVIRVNFSSVSSLKIKISLSDNIVLIGDIPMPLRSNQNGLCYVYVMLCYVMLYLPCTFFTSWCSDDVRYVCALLGSSLIILFRFPEALAFWYISRLFLKVFLLLVLETCVFYHSISSCFLCNKNLENFC